MLLWCTMLMQGINVWLFIPSCFSLFYLLYPPHLLLFSSSTSLYISYWYASLRSRISFITCKYDNLLSFIILQNIEMFFTFPVQYSFQVFFFPSSFLCMALFYSTIEWILLGFGWVWIFNLLTKIMQGLYVKLFQVFHPIYRVLVTGS